MHTVVQTKDTHTKVAKMPCINLIIVIAIVIVCACRCQDLQEVQWKKLFQFFLLKNIHPLEWLSFVVFAENILLLVSTYHCCWQWLVEEACTQLAAIVVLLTCFLCSIGHDVFGIGFRTKKTKKNSLAKKTNRHFYGVNGKGMHPLSCALW